MSFGWPAGGAEMPMNAGIYGNPQIPPMPTQMAIPGAPQPPNNVPSGFPNSIPRGPASNANAAAGNAPGVAGAAAGGVADQVCNVWKKNFAYHMALLRHYIGVFNFVTIDVKFPGIVSRPIGTFHSTAEFHYQTLRSNIDLVEPIQLGITLTDANGNVPPGVNHMGTWQFNFKFNPETAMCTSEGLDVLKQSGLDLARHQAEGIELGEFFENLTTSGLVLNPNVTWITFYSGYDLGLLVSQLINRAVPNEKEEYMSLVKRFFPEVWDVKMLVKAFNLSPKNYLHEIAEDFQLFRVTVWSSAGADSRLAALCFYEIMRSLGDHAFSVKNRLFGLESDSQPTEEDVQSQSVNAHQFSHPVQTQAQVQAQAVQAHAQGMAPPPVPGGPPGMAPPGGVPPMMAMPPYMYNPSANPQVGGRQPMYYPN